MYQKLLRAQLGHIKPLPRGFSVRLQAFVSTLHLDNHDILCTLAVLTITKRLALGTTFNYWMVNKDIFSSSFGLAE